MAKRRTFLFDGIGVSGGVVIGPAYCIEPQGFKVESHHISAEDVDQEVERFERAVEYARQEVQQLGKEVAERIDPQQAAIFDAHLTLLEDPLLIEQTVRSIRDGRRNAEFVFWSITKEIGERLRSLGDSYFGERSHDLYDVARRVLKFLDEIKHPSGDAMPKGAVIIANDLGPSETAVFHRDKIAGFVTDAGGPTSHTAIMAKALGLPAVVGLDFVTHYVRNGDRIIVDGTEGKVVLNPTLEQVQYYEERAEEFLKVRENFLEIRELPAVSLDGVRIDLQANIEFTNELSMVLSNGAEGVGLFRTEYFFIERKSLPSEDEQEHAYRQVLEALEGKPVVFRTLDVGGDKLADNIPTPPENNPFLGLRAIRLCLAYPDLFRCQIRPLIRAASGCELNILLPMISGLKEVRLARELIQEVYEEVQKSGATMPSSLRVGAMIEIPSAALQVEAISKQVDFLSIGTNDLIQYTLAVDRVNKLVGSLFKETHPAVLLLIAQIVQSCKKTGTPLSVCGEMAGEPMMAQLLIGMGIRNLSMSPTLIGPVKKAIRSIEVSYLEEMANELLSYLTATEVRENLVRKLSEYQRPAGEQISS